MAAGWKAFARIAGGTVLILGGALLGLLALYGLAFFFDAPGSEKQPMVWALALSYLALGPSLAVAGGFLIARRPRVLLLLPLAVVGLIVLFSVLIGVLCDGQFVCR